MTNSKQENSNHELAIDSIYTALLQLMEKKEYSKISITDITNRAGVSRMAYYRNYKSKDEILTKRLEAVLNKFYDRVLQDKENSDTSSKDAKEDFLINFMTNFFDEFQKDPVLHAIIKAGLIDKILELHRNFMYNIFKYILDLDMDNAENQRIMYYEMGGIAGLIMYCQSKDFKADSKLLAKEVLKQMKSDLEI